MAITTLWRGASVVALILATSLLLACVNEKLPPPSTVNADEILTQFRRCGIDPPLRLRRLSPV